MLHQSISFNVISSLCIHLHKKKIRSCKPLFITMLRGQPLVGCEKEYRRVEIVRTELVCHPEIERNLIFVTSVGAVNFTDGFDTGIESLLIGLLHLQCRIKVVYSLPHYAGFMPAGVQAQDQNYICKFLHTSIRRNFLKYSAKILKAA